MKQTKEMSIKYCFEANDKFFGTIFFFIYFSFFSGFCLFAPVLELSDNFVLCAENEVKMISMNEPRGKLLSFVDYTSGNWAWKKMRAEKVWEKLKIVFFLKKYNHTHTDTSKTKNNVETKNMKFNWLHCKQ